MPRQSTTFDEPDTSLIDAEAQDTEQSPEEAAAQIKKDNEERVAILDGLAKSIEDKLKARVPLRARKENEWRKAESLYHAPLNNSDNDLPETPFESKPTSKRRPYPNIVRIKCDTAIANNVSMQFAGGTEKNWDLAPPANNTDPNESAKCRLMEAEIETQLASTKYMMKSRKAITDRVILGTGALKGPVNTGKRRIKYERLAGGEWVPKVSDEKTPSLEQVSPWRLYPDMTVNDFEDSLDMIEIHSLRPLELAVLAENPGFDGDTIRKILKGDEGNDAINPATYNSEVLMSIKAEDWARNPYLYKDRYLVTEYHGPVSYDDAMKLGLDPTYQSPTMDYYGEVWVCAGKVIRMELENIEGHYETPYAMTTWKNDPTSPFGYGHPLLLADAQKVITQTYHMILDNAALTSGTQVAMYHKYIQPIDNDWTIRPNKVWLLTDPAAKIEEAIKFFTPTNNISSIMPVLALTREFADEESATSGIASGMASPELTDTATGQLMMRQGSTTLLDFMAEDYDDQVTEKIIRRWYAWNMQYNPKDEIKGDYLIDVKSSSQYKNKQMHVRDLERLSMEYSQNPLMQDMINGDELTRARLTLMHIPYGDIVRTPEQIEQARQQRSQAPDPKMIEMQIKMAQVENEKARLELDKQNQQFEQQKAMYMAQMEWQEKMGSNQARMAEAQAQVITAQSERQIEMFKLAQKDKQFSAKLNNDQSIAKLSTDAQVFLESMRQATKERDQHLTEQELQIKRETGEGI
jgi:hypothetical protein